MKTEKKTEQGSNSFLDFNIRIYSVKNHTLSLLACTWRHPSQSTSCSLQSIRICLLAPTCLYTPVTFSFFQFGCGYGACLKAGAKGLRTAVSSVRVLLSQLLLWPSFLSCAQLVFQKAVLWLVLGESWEAVGNRNTCNMLPVPRTAWAWNRKLFLFPGCLNGCSGGILCPLQVL